MVSNVFFHVCELRVLDLDAGPLHNWMWKNPVIFEKFFSCPTDAKYVTSVPGIIIFHWKLN